MAPAFNRLKVVAEPGGAVALAAALFRADQIEGDDVIVDHLGRQRRSRLCSPARL